MRIRRTRCTRAPVTTLMGNEGSGQALFRITGLGQGRAARETETVDAAPRAAVRRGWADSHEARGVVVVWNRPGGGGNALPAHRPPCQSRSFALPGGALHRVSQPPRLMDSFTIHPFAELLVLSNLSTSSKTSLYRDGFTEESFKTRKILFAASVSALSRET